jgi:phospholipase/carboxylesterase
MNRLAVAAECVSVPKSPVSANELLDVRSFTRRRPLRELREPLATFAPIHYEPGYAYPLVIWLHSSMGSERELRQVMPLVSMRNYVGAAPRGNAIDARRSTGFCWQQTHGDIEAAENRVAECIAAASRQFNIHSQRIFLAGCGTGGTMALRVAWNDPGRFAGVVAINGPLPTLWRPLGRVNELRRVPCLLVSSRDSSAYPASRVCSDLKLLHSAGCTVALRQYPGSDDLTSKMLSDMDQWMMDLVCCRNGKGSA